jgi:endonuclease YncB( thermonuclease family)
LKILFPCPAPLREDVACILIKEGYARPWTGRREDWCQSLDRRDHAEAALYCAVAY